MDITTLGIDLAKSVFQLHGVALNNLFVFLHSCCAWSDPFGDWNH